ncbi:AI-2E family transporter [Salinilacihabitans rarus]|uniref:AI-2E family transporter n=1 Tax=Salinilacihabitans rarus TaxID=2961596 RepID=UPI0020C8519E|nr:AI-2E family transporter [Salinilacihabitans rarus]
MSQEAPPGRATSATDRRWLGLLALVVGLFAALVVLPYLQYVLAAIVLAYVLYPLQRRLEPRFGRTVTAVIVLALGTVAILIPVAVILAAAIEQGLEIADAVAAGDLGVEEVERRLGEFGLEVDLQELYGQLREPIGTVLQGLTNEAAGIVGGVPEFLIGLTVLLFVLYSLLRDGDRFVDWLGSVLPLRPAVRADLFRRVDRLMYVAIVANVLVAGVQALLTVIGLALVGVSGLAFFGILTFVVSLLPLVGASLVWAPTSLYLLLVGRPVAGALLFAYGAVIVSLSDNVLRPITVGRGASLSVAVVILGIFGGVAVAGVMGLFFGPIVLGTLKTLLELYAREAPNAEAPAEAETSAAESPDGPRMAESPDAPESDGEPEGR